MFKVGDKVYFKKKYNMYHKKGLDPIIIVGFLPKCFGFHCKSFYMNKPYHIVMVDTTDQGYIRDLSESDYTEAHSFITNWNDKLFSENEFRILKLKKILNEI